MNKTTLLASTALVSAALCVGAGGAHALSLKLGGYAEFWAGWADAEDGDVANRVDVKHDAEIHFRAEEKLDNGLTVGFVAELEAGPGNALGSGPSDATGVSGETGDDTAWDEMFAYVKSGFGQFNIGNNDNASGYVGAVRTVGPVGIFKSDAGDWIPGAYAGTPTPDVDLGFSDSQNITYFTPRIAGVQLIVSYTPDQSDIAEGHFDESLPDKAHHLMSGAVRFNRKFGGVGVGLAAGYSKAENADSALASSLEGYNAGADLRFGPARVTAVYAFENLDGRDDEHYGASLIYSLSKMHTVSLGYGHGERSDGADLETDIITAGWTMNMGSGVSFAASVFHAESEGTDPVEDLSGIGVVGGLRLTF